MKKLRTLRKYLNVFGQSGKLMAFTVMVGLSSLSKLVLQDTK